MADGDATPPAVFDAAGEETRMAILRALVAAYNESPADPWLPYSELRDAAGVRDNGNFNYHLDRLGDLVVKEPAGYRVSRIGMAVVSATASGVFDAEWTWGPVDAPGECPVCGAADLTLRYADGLLWLRCGADDGHEFALSVPPNLLDSHPEEAVVERVAFAEHQWIAATCEGICAECHGRVDARVEPGLDGADHYDYHGECERCGFHHGMPVGMSLLAHPEVVAFYRERGTDVRTTPWWTLECCAPGAETVVSETPLRLRVDVECAGEVLSVTVDESGAVVGTATPRSPGW